jgi:hypothetical protein
MKTNERYADKLELFFDYNFIRRCELELISNEELDNHMFIIYKPGGELIHGWIIERIRIYE